MEKIIFATARKPLEKLPHYVVFPTKIILPRHLQSIKICPQQNFAKAAKQVMKRQIKFLSQGLILISLRNVDKKLRKSKRHFGVSFILPEFTVYNLLDYDFANSRHPDTFFQYHILQTSLIRSLLSPD